MKPSACTLLAVASLMCPCIPASAAREPGIPRPHALVESPAERANAALVMRNFTLLMNGRYRDGLATFSPHYVDHDAAVDFAADAQRWGNSGPADPAELTGALARPTGGTVVLYRTHGCDIFHVRKGLITDHWTCRH